MTIASAYAALIIVLVLILFGMAIHAAMIMSMPGYYKCMPAPRPGRFMACVIRTNPFNAGREVFAEECNCRRKAYIKARFAALRYDLLTPSQEDLGIDWAVRELK